VDISVAQEEDQKDCFNGPLFTITSQRYVLHPFAGPWSYFRIPTLWSTPAISQVFVDQQRDDGEGQPWCRHIQSSIGLSVEAIGIPSPRNALIDMQGVFLRDMKARKSVGSRPA
jgi:hypothetical protein